MNAKIIENASGYQDPMEEIAAEGTEVEAEENELIVKFKKPFTYEGETYTQIDLTGIESMTGAQLCSAQRMYSKSKSVSLTPELDPNYAAIIGHIVVKLPIEFFYALPAKELAKVKRAVSGFFFGDD
jgi:hypothetical protein